MRLLKDVMPGEQVGDWIIFKKFIPGHRYGIGADVSEGIGRDANAAVVIDFSSKQRFTTLPEVVARYKNNRIDPNTFSYELASMGNQYGSCIIAVERNNHGHATINKLKEMYFNLYREHTKDRELDKMTEKLGWHTTAATKPELLMSLKFAIENNELLIPDRSALMELKKYGSEDLKQIRYDDKLSQHFDILMALAIAWEMRNHAVMSGGKVTLIEEPLNAKRIIQ